MKHSLTRLLLVLLFTTSFCLAQNNTTVTGTVTDSDAQVWANGSWSWTLFNPTGGGNAVFINGTPVPKNVSGSLNSSGAFQAGQTVPNNAQILPTGTQANLKICALTSAPNSCQTYHISVTGSSFNLGTRLSSLIQPPRQEAAATTYNYNTAEILNPVQGTGYINTISNACFLFQNGSYVSCGGGGGSGNVVGQLNAIGSFSSATATKPTNGTVDNTGNFFGTPNINNVSQACHYAGATLYDKITAAQVAWNNIPVEIDVTADCTNFDIATDLHMQDNHNLIFTQGLTVNLSVPIFAGSNSVIAGIGDKVVVKLIPNPGEQSGFYIDNPASNIYIHDFTLDANADAFIAAGITTNRNRPIQVSANNGSIPGPSNITIQRVHFKNGSQDFFIAGGSSSTAVNKNILIDSNIFENGYSFDVRLQSFMNNITVSNNLFTGYMRPYSLPISTVTASGTTATINLTLGMPDVIVANNGPHIYVSGCNDTKYNVAFPDNVIPSFTTGSTSVTYTIPAGAAPSATGCIAFIQNSQAPIRGGLDADNYGWTFNANKLDNTYLARHYGIELFGGIPAHIYLHGASITNELHDARGSDGGTGFSLGGEKILIANNRLINGTGNSTANGCECSIINSTVTGDVVERGSYAFNSSGGVDFGGVAVSNLNFVGPVLGSGEGMLEVNNVDSTYSNISIDLKQSAGGTGVAVGHYGGAVRVANVELNNINVIGQASFGGAPSQCFSLDGGTTSSNVRFNGGSCKGVEVGLNVQPGSTIQDVQLRNIDLSGVLTNYLILRGATNVMQSGLKFSTTYPNDTDQTGRNVYGALSLIAMQANGSMGVLVRGSSGATIYDYNCIGVSGTVIFSAAVAEGVINGNATLSGSNYNEITCPVFLGATATRIYRTVGGATQGLIATVSNNAASVNDTGLAGDGTSPPASNNLPILNLGAVTITGLDGTTIHTDSSGKLQTNGITASCTTSLTVVNGIVTSCI